MVSTHDPSCIAPITSIIYDYPNFRMASQFPLRPLAREADIRGTWLHYIELTLPLRCRPNHHKGAGHRHALPWTEPF